MSDDQHNLNKDNNTSVESNSISDDNQKNKSNNESDTYENIPGNNTENVKKECGSIDVPPVRGDIKKNLVFGDSNNQQDKNEGKFIVGLAWKNDWDAIENKKSNGFIAQANATAGANMSCDLNVISSNNMMNKQQTSVSGKGSGTAVLKSTGVKSNLNNTKTTSVFSSYTNLAIPPNKSTVSTKNQEQITVNKSISSTSKISEAFWKQIEELKTGNANNVNNRKEKEKEQILTTPNKGSNEVVNNICVTPKNPQITNVAQSTSKANEVSGKVNTVHDCVDIVDQFQPLKKTQTTTQFESMQRQFPSQTQSRELLQIHNQTPKQLQIQTPTAAELQIQPQDQRFEELSNLIIEPKSKEQIYSEKIKEWDIEIQKIKNGNNKITKLREDYEKMNSKLQKDTKEFNKKKEAEQAQIQTLKDEELKRLAKERKQWAYEQKQFNENRNKAQAVQSSSKKDKDQIELLKNQISQIQEDSRLKDANNKLLMERYKKQWDEAGSKIIELNTIITRYQNQDMITLTKQQHQLQKQTPPSYDYNTINYEIEQIINQNNIPPNTESLPAYLNMDYKAGKGRTPDIKAPKLSAKGIPNSNPMNNINDDEDNYDLIFPDKYHKFDFELLSTDSSQEGKVVKLYTNNKKEIIFQSGVRKELFEDGYQIAYFNNGDVKQSYPNGKIVYYFCSAKTVQTTYPDKLQVLKFENGQIEKHYLDGTKQISFPDGSLRYILPDGYEETYYWDGKVQKIDQNGVITIDHEDGRKEVKYPNEKGEKH